MSRYQFWLSGEEAGVVSAESIDDAVHLFTEENMLGYDPFSSAGKWLEEMHRMQIKENLAEQVAVVCLDTGFVLELARAHRDENGDFELR